MQLHSFAELGYEGYLVTLECEIRKGLPSFSIVGLPGAAVQESRQRVLSALSSCGYDFYHQKILINLSPGNRPKHGSSFDLPIALAILQSSGQLHVKRSHAHRCLLMGELTLAGGLRSTNSDMSSLLSDEVQNLDEIIVSAELSSALLGLPQSKAPVKFANSLSGVINLLLDKTPAHHLSNAKSTPADPKSLIIESPIAPIGKPQIPTSFSSKSIRALAIAAAGMHNILLFGPPGSGKTTSARLLDYLVPSPKDTVLLQQLRIHARKTTGDRPLLPIRTCREPHHSSSAEGIIGGGRQLKPGEIALAHGGVLILDEAPEFNRNVLQQLREPMEAAQVDILRADISTAYPSKSIFAFTMNLCPCGNRGRADAQCMCSLGQIQRYWSQLGGALYDRIDVRVFMGGADESKMSPRKEGDDSLSSLEQLEIYRQKIEQIRRFQNNYWKVEGCYNAYLNEQELENRCYLNQLIQKRLESMLNSGLFSYRQLLSIKKLMLSITELDAPDQNEIIEPGIDVLDEAISLIRPRLYGEYL